MELIWHGTAAVELKCGQGTILFDPFVTLKHSPVDVKIEEYDGFTDIFITHCHLDHVENLPDIVKRNPGVMIYGTQITVETLAKEGIPRTNLTLLRYGDEKKVNGFTIQVYHGRHAVLPKVDGKRIAGWIRSKARFNVPPMLKAYMTFQENDESIFYQIEAEGKTIALMGSMNLRDEIDYPKGADVLVLPYNGWDDNLPPAIRIIDRLKPGKVLLDHYDDTFPPVSSEVDVSPLVNRYAGRVSALQIRTPEQIG